MSPESKPRGFPFGLTSAVAIALVILVGLGVWQLQRLKWKEGLLAHIAALKDAPTQPIGPVLERSRQGQDVEWTRVTAVCAPAAAAISSPLTYALRDGKIVWRAQTPCALGEGPYPVITVDRGYVEATAGRMQADSIGLPAPGRVTGVLRNLAARGGDRGPSPLTLVAEREDPAPPGVTPSALPEKITNNHLSYALTWFGLAAALLGVYAAMLFRRRTAA